MSRDEEDNDVETDKIRGSTIGHHLISSLRKVAKMNPTRHEKQWEKFKQISHAVNATWSPGKGSE